MLGSSDLNSIIEASQRELTQLFGIRRLSASQIVPENILLGGGIDSTYLKQVEISPTDSCNQNCVWCFTSYARKAKHFLTASKVRAYLEQFASQGGNTVIFSGGGEPTLYKKLYEACDEFDGLSIINFCLDMQLNVGLITNGLFLDRLKKDVDISRLCFIRVSLDTLNRNAYSALHDCPPNHLDKVIQNIRKVAELKGRNILPGYGVSFIVSPSHALNITKNEVSEICEFAKPLDLDFVQFKHLHTQDYISAEEQLSQVHQFATTLDWGNTEYWVQKYNGPQPDKECRVTQYIQAVGNQDKSFPCCHLFGQTQYFDQKELTPRGQIIHNCPTKVCRYVSINQVLSTTNEQASSLAKEKLFHSLEKEGYHPYRFIPTAPYLYVPFKTKRKEFT